MTEDLQNEARLNAVMTIIHGNTKVVAFGNALRRINSRDVVMKQPVQASSKAHLSICQEYSSVAACISMWLGFSGSPVLAYKDGKMLYV